MTAHSSRPSNPAGSTSWVLPDTEEQSGPETYCAAWRAHWRSLRRFVMLTSSLKDPGRFVAYGTDGCVSFQVEGSWRTDLSPFLAKMDADGAELVPPPHVTLAMPAGQPTFPDPVTVRHCLQARVGRNAAA
jgi:hypothetical protein